MAEFPFQLFINCASSGNNQESLLCTDLLRAIPGKRAIYDAMWKDTNVIVKVFSHKIKAKLHFKRELKGLKQLQKRGINSAGPLISGKTDDGRWVIVLEKITGSATVLDVLAATTDNRAELGLFVRVCRELAKQHSRGILQKDLHLENFLLADDRLYSIDPSQMVFLSDQVPRKESISQLALLALNLPGSDIQATRIICEEYFNARGWNFEKSDEALFRQQQTLRRERGIRRGLKKCLRTSTRFLRIRDGETVAVFDRDFCRGAEPFDFAGQIDTLMDEGHVLKNGNTCYVSRLTWNGEDVVVKRYNHKGFIHSLRHTIKSSRARGGWLHAHRLGMLDVATPKPLAYIEQRKRFLIWKSYLVTRYCEGQKLYDFLRDENITQEQRSTVTEQVRNLLNKMGKHRITHGDLKNSNILVTKTGPVLIDLDGMKVHKWDWLCKVQKAKDLERLAKDK
jgi:tRNA A-37 threonylcarbamoyl transferase component Bud32